MSENSTPVDPPASDFTHEPADDDPGSAIDSVLREVASFGETGPDGWDPDVDVHRETGFEFDYDADLDALVDPEGDLGAIQAFATTTTGDAQPPEAELSYRPYGPHGALLGLIGVLFALPSFLLTLLLSAVGYLLYRTRATAPVSFERRALVTIEPDGPRSGAGRSASNRQPSGATSIRVTVESFALVEPEGIRSLDWPARRTLIATLEDCAGGRVGPDRSSWSPERGFFEHLSMWSNRRPDADVSSVERIVRDRASSPDDARRFTAAVLEALDDTPDTREHLQTSVERLEARLRSLLEDTDTANPNDSAG